MTRSQPGAAARVRRPRAQRNWHKPFLIALAETSNVSAAARAARIGASWAYKTKREDRDFAEAWLVALCEGYDRLEIELLGRLRQGESRDGPPVRHDNATALRLLLAHRDSRSRFRAQQDNVTAEEVSASIEAKLARLREVVLEREARERTGSRSAADGR